MTKRLFTALVLVVVSSVTLCADPAWPTNWSLGGLASWAYLLRASSSAEIATVSGNLAAHQADQSDPHGATMTVSQGITLGAGAADAYVSRYATGVVQIASWAYLPPTTATPAVSAVGMLRANASGDVSVYDSNGSWSTFLTDYPHWQDLRVSLLSTKLGGSKEPGFTVVRTDGAGSQGVFAYSFDADTEQELYCSVQLPHGITKSIIVPHVHWTSSQAVASSVVWGLEYCLANVTGAYPATSTILIATGTHSGVAYSHNLTDLGEIDISTANDSAVLLIRFYRKAADAGDDAAAAWATDLDFHYQIGVLGSNNEHGD